MVSMGAEELLCSPRHAHSLRHVRQRHPSKTTQAVQTDAQSRSTPGLKYCNRGKHRDPAFVSLIQPEDEGQDPVSAEVLVLWVVPKNACATPVGWTWNHRTVGSVADCLQRPLSRGHENLPVFLDGDMLAVVPWYLIHYSQPSLAIWVAPVGRSRLCRM